MSKALRIYPCCGGPSRSKICTRFGTVTSTAHLPVVLCDVPKHYNVRVDIRAVDHLTGSYPRVIYIGRTNNGISHIGRLVRIIPRGFAILYNSSNLAIPFVTYNTDKLISMASGLIPNVVGSVIGTNLGRSVKRVLSLRGGFCPLVGKLVALSSGPIPVGTTLTVEKSVRPNVHLPLIPLTRRGRTRLSTLLRHFGVLWRFDSVVSVLIANVSNHVNRTVRRTIARGPSAYINSARSRKRRLCPTLTGYSMTVSFSRRTFADALLTRTITGGGPLIVNAAKRARLRHRRVISTTTSVPVIFTSGCSMKIGTLF